MQIQIQITIPRADKELGTWTIAGNGIFLPSLPLASFGYGQASLPLCPWGKGRVGMSAKADARRSKACQSASFTLPSSHRGNLVPHQGGVAAMSGTCNSREEKSVLRAGMFMQARLKKRDRKQCTESWGGPRPEA